MSNHWSVDFEFEGERFSSTIVHYTEKQAKELAKKIRKVLPKSKAEAFDNDAML